MVAIASFDAFALGGFRTARNVFAFDINLRVTVRRIFAFDVNLRVTVRRIFAFDRNLRAKWHSLRHCK